MSDCDHGVTFDEEAAKKLLTYAEVRRCWPRGYFTKDKPCPKGCGVTEGIYYASYAHYIYGDW